MIQKVFDTTEAASERPLGSNSPYNSEIRISLAEWSLHRALFSGELDHLDFPAKAKHDFGIAAVDYVNVFFGGKKMTPGEAAKDLTYLGELMSRSENAGVINHLLMVDHEGPLASPVASERLQAVEDHKKWIEAAKFLGCSTMRVNLHGDGQAKAKKDASVDSLLRLADFTAGMEINIVVENHGNESSDGSWLAEIMRLVNKPHIGTLPDFGNFCLTHPWGETQTDCAKVYDRYKVVEELLPFAKTVSAKD